MVNLLPRSLQLVVIAVLILGLLIMIKELSQPVRNDWRWVEKTASRSVFGATLVAISFSALLASTRFTSEFEYYLVLGLILLSTGYAVFMKGLVLIAQSQMRQMPPEPEGDIQP